MIKHARVVIVKEKKILLIHRLNKGREYYIIPGGHVDPGEKPEQTAIREAKEETNLDIEMPKLLWKIKDEFDGEKKELYIFLVDKFRGNKLKMIGPEVADMSENNKYDFEWVQFKNLNKIDIKPKLFKAKLLEKFK